MSGRGSGRIPAVRSPDGTLIYLVQSGVGSIWDDDFELEPAEDETGNLAGIDHVVLALPAGRTSTYVLFWRALFGLSLSRNWRRRTRMAWCKAERW